MAQAVVEAAGDAVDKLDATPLSYNNKDEILNPFFIVHGKSDVDWFESIPGKLRKNT